MLLQAQMGTTVEPPLFRKLAGELFHMKESEDACMV
jgi:hypothetical protein